MRRALDDLWKKPERANEIIAELRSENTDIYRFEEMLEKGDSEINTNLMKPFDIPIFSFVR